MAKFVKEYRIPDGNGNTLGPPQKFEGDSWEEIADKVAAAHQNAAAEMYRTKQGAKLSILMDADPEQPMYEFKEKSLSADELVGIQGLLKDPRTAAEGHKRLLEAQLGAPISKIRQNLQIAEVLSRTNDMAWEIEKFKRAQPNYVECDANKDKLIAYLTHKDRNWAITAKNLEIAFEHLSEQGELVTRAPEPIQASVATPPVAELPPQPAVATPEPPPQPEIPAVATVGAPISAPAADRTAAPAVTAVGSTSTGLTRDSGGTNHPPEPPKTKGITPAEISRMSSSQYLDRYEHDPEFKKQVDAIYNKK